MRTFVATLVASALVGLSTQTTVSDLPFEINISIYDISTLNGWCASQIHVCDVLCDNDTKSNSCLPGPPPVWECTCNSNSSEPGAQYYSSSMQAILCQQAFGQCQEANAGDSQAQETECEEGIQATCGTLDITDFDSGSDEDNVESTTTSAAPATTTSSSSTPAATTDIPDFAASVPVFATSGLAVIIVGVFAQLL
jgi:hypothetical protein